MYVIQIPPPPRTWKADGPVREALEALGCQDLNFGRVDVFAGFGGGSCGGGG